MTESNKEAVARLGLKKLDMTQMVVIRKTRDIIAVSFESSHESYICNAIDLAARATISYSEHAYRVAADLKLMVESRLQCGPDAAMDANRLHTPTFGGWLMRQRCCPHPVGDAYMQDRWEWAGKYARRARLAWLDRIIELEAM